MSDLIDRQAAVDALDCINGVEEVLRSLPSAQPEYKPVTVEDFAKAMDTVRSRRALSICRNKVKRMSRPIDAENRQKPQKLIVRENRNNSDADHLFCPICKWPVGEWYARSRWAMMYNTDDTICPHCGQVFDLKKTKQEAFEEWNRRVLWLEKMGY